MEAKNLEDLDFSPVEKQFLNFAIGKYTSQIEAGDSDPDETQNSVTEAVYEAIDQINNHYINEGEIKHNQRPSCKAGCSHCCNVMVAANEREVNLVVDYMEQNNIQVDMNVLKIQSEITDTKEYVLSPHRKCVFLKDNMCSIYKVRPSSCRNYFVYSPPEDCDTYNNTSNHDGQTLLLFNMDVVPLTLALMRSSPDGIFPKILYDKLIEKQSNL